MFFNISMMFYFRGDLQGVLNWFESGKEPIGNLLFTGFWWVIELFLTGSWWVVGLSITPF